MTTPMVEPFHLVLVPTVGLGNPVVNPARRQIPGRPAIWEMPPGAHMVHITWDGARPLRLHMWNPGATLLKEEIPAGTAGTRRSLIVRVGAETSFGMSAHIGTMTADSEEIISGSRVLVTVIPGPLNP